MATAIENKNKLVSFATAYALVTENFANPKPHPRTVAAWLRDWRVRCVKRNPQATRGGGRRWFVQGDVEKAIAEMVR